MIPSTHAEYIDHVHEQFAKRATDPDFQASLDSYAYETVTLLDLSLDAQRDPLADLYCPTGQGDPYDPIRMLRSWLLMTLDAQTSSPDNWARRLRREPVLAILAGFEPGHTPCATAHRDFITRYADGPYAMRKRQDATVSDTLKGQHERRLADTTAARQAEANREHTSQSDILCRRLLEHAETSRTPNALQTRLDNLLVDLALTPSLDAGLLGDTPHKSTVSGDGTPLETAASPTGKKTCACPPNRKDCDHPRLYTSGTAQWCYHPHRGFVFGDESYTLSTIVSGHDIPLMSIMGTGNESDFTLGPKAMDELLKTIRERNLPLGIDIFVGDGHHDALPIYRYCKVKGILAVIPLNGDSHETTADTIHPHVDAYPNVTFDTDGVPLCPAGCRMRHEHYQSRQDAHYYTCPATRRNGKGVWIFHANECPFHADCCPDKKVGYSQYLAADTNPRLFPEIPRSSKRFKILYSERTGVERSNATEDSYHLDRCTRHAAYGLIRLMLVNCAKHAKLRWREQRKSASAKQLLQAMLARLRVRPERTSQPR